MKKLRLAVLGKNGKNLDDLESMDGNLELNIIFLQFFKFNDIFRVRSHFRPGVIQLSGLEVLQQDTFIQVRPIC